MNQATLARKTSDGQSARQSANENYGSAKLDDRSQRQELQTPSGFASAPAGENSDKNRAVLPPVDIIEDDTGITLMADLPGVSKESLGIKVVGDDLVIEGTASVPVGAEMELLYGEVQSPYYRRSFTLSNELDPDRIEAKLSHGVLRLRIPKAEEAKPRRIEVTVG